MALFCIPKKDVEKLKQSALKGQINVSELYKMSSKERRDFFSTYTDKNLGKILNTEFEKAMISKQKTALRDWAQSVFKPEAKVSPVYKNIVDKIAALDEMGVLTPESEKAFLEDLVSDKLGVTVTPEEVEKISEKAKAIDEAQKKVGDDIGNPFKMQENLDFFKAKKDMDNYLQELNPSSNLKVLTGTIGRAAMLASVKSPLLNIASNMEIGFTEFLGRRLASGQIKGGNNSLAIDFVKMANKIYQETGYDISRMMSISDDGASGGRVLGDSVHARGEGAIKRVGQFAEDIVFKQLMGAPDAVFAASHFADSVNLSAMKIAKGDKARATNIMTDAMRMVPQTPEGEIVRQQAIMDAQTATWTNTTWASKTSEKVRGALNELSGDLRAGDYLMPFIKTPANVIATGMEYGGGGILGGLVKTVKAYRSGNLGTKEHMQSIIPGLIRSGLGLTFAAALAAGLDDDDFVGAYDPKRVQIESLRNSNYNAFRAGGKWISTDWLGPLAVPFTAMMYARQGEKTISAEAQNYVMNVASNWKEIPGFQVVSDAVGSSGGEDKPGGEVLQDSINYLSSEVFTRLVPSIVSDLAKAFDTKERQTTDTFSKIQSKIPGVRNHLPVKANVFGEDIEDEGFITNILFGSRIKTDKENEMVKELSEIQKETDKSLNFTDWSKSTNASLSQFKEKIGVDKYETAKKEYGIELKKLIDQKMKSSAYEKMDSDDKLKELLSLDTDAMKTIFKKYGFTYKKEAKPSNSQKTTASRNMVDLVGDYAKAYGVDPENAFKAMFTSEKLGKVEGNLVQLERFKGIGYNEKGGSEDVINKMLKDAGIDPKDRKEYNLEHIVPVSSGGGTDLSNLYPEKRSVHNSYTPTDTLAGKLMEEGKINRDQVTEIMKKLKIEKSITIEQAKDMLDKFNE